MFCPEYVLALVIPPGARNKETINPMDVAGESEELADLESAIVGWGEVRRPTLVLFTKLPESALRGFLLKRLCPLMRLGIDRRFVVELSIADGAPCHCKVKVIRARRSYATPEHQKLALDEEGMVAFPRGNCRATFRSRHQGPESSESAVDPDCRCHTGVDAGGIALSEILGPDYETREVFPSASYKMLDAADAPCVTIDLRSFSRGPKDMLDAYVAALTVGEFKPGSGCEV